MFRRNFLSSAAGVLAFCGLGKLSDKVAPKPFLYKDDALGKFVRLKTFRAFETQSVFEMGTLGPYHKYLSFPVEMEVTLEYENGEHVFSAFNVTKETCQMMADDPMNFVKFATEAKCDSELDEQYGMITVHFNENKFKLASISYWHTETFDAVVRGMGELV